MKKGKTPFRPLNPHHPTPTGDSWAGGLEKENPFSKSTKGHEEWSLIRQRTVQTISAL
jgi:hypothetical protein